MRRNSAFHGANSFRSYDWCIGARMATGLPVRRAAVKKSRSAVSGKSLRQLLDWLAMTDIQIWPEVKINSAVALVHALRTAGKPVRDVYQANDGGYRVSFDGWEVDAAVVDEAVAKGWLVLTYPKKSRE